MSGGHATPENVDGVIYLVMSLRNIGSGPAGDVGLWQGAIRDRDDPGHREIADAISQREPMTVELMYSDQVGAQRTITRYTLVPLSPDSEDEANRFHQHRPELVSGSRRAALTRARTAAASAAISRTISPAGRA